MIQPTNDRGWFPKTENILGLESMFRKSLEINEAEALPNLKAIKQRDLLEACIQCIGYLSRLIQKERQDRLGV